MMKILKVENLVGMSLLLYFLFSLIPQSMFQLTKVLTIRGESKSPGSNISVNGS